MIATESKIKIFHDKLKTKQKTFFDSSEEVFKNTKDILEKVERKKKSSIYLWLVPTSDSAFWMDGLCLET